MGVKSLLVTVGIMLACFTGATGMAAEKTAAEAPKGESSADRSTPQGTVESVTSRMMDVIRDGEEDLKKNPDQYYGNVRKVLEETVSFPFIAKSVMATYWSKASEEQRERFTEVFTRGMVETLGKGMANYSDLKITTLPPAKEDKGKRRVEVVQEIQGTEGVNRVSYTMAQNRSGEWKLINVVLNGVNLGKSFRDQFAQSMRQNDNDIDKVIDGWSMQGQP